MDRNAGDSGFTLLEVLIVLALLSLATATAIVWAPGAFDRVALERTASRIERELTRLGAQAATTGQDQIAAIDVSTMPPTLRVGAEIMAIDSDTELRWVAAQEAGSDDERAMIIFFGSGGASGGTIALNRNISRVAIEVDWLTASIRRTE